MPSEHDGPDRTASPALGSTPRLDEARRSVTRTRVTPPPGVPGQPEPVPTSGVRRLIDRLRASQHGELTKPREPLPGCHPLRTVLSIMLSLLGLLTLSGAVLVLLLWQQDRASGALASQIDRTWDLFDGLRMIERWVAFAAVPVAVVWIALATVNVFRATGKRRSAVVAAASLPIAVFGAWLVGDQIVAGSDDWLARASGFVLQLVALAIVLLALERVALTAESRRRPLRAAYVLAALWLASLQFLAGLSTADQASEPDHWGRLGAYLVIAGLLQLLGALVVSEAARSLEDGTRNRYELRSKFGEALLAQAART